MASINKAPHAILVPLSDNAHYSPGNYLYSIHQSFSNQSPKWNHITRWKTSGKPLKHLFHVSSHIAHCRPGLNRAGLSVVMRRTPFEENDWGPKFILFLRIEICLILQIFSLCFNYRIFCPNFPQAFYLFRGPQNGFIAWRAPIPENIACSDNRGIYSCW